MIFSIDDFGDDGGRQLGLHCSECPECCECHHRFRWLHDLVAHYEGTEYHGSLPCKKPYEHSCGCEVCLELAEAMHGFWYDPTHPFYHKRRLEIPPSRS
jgi:hypothetical protein